MSENDRASEAWHARLPKSITRPVVTAKLLGQESFGAISGSIALVVMLAVAVAPSTGAGIWRLGGYDLVCGVNAALAVGALVAFALALRFGRGGSAA